MTSISSPVIHDITLPLHINMWPPAVGWWLLLVICVLLMYCLFTLLRWRIKTQHIRQSARLLAALECNKACLIHCQQLVRASALKHYGRRQVASLCGNNWSAFIRCKMKLSEKEITLVDMMATAAYQPAHPSLDRAALVKLTLRWLRRHP